MCKDALFRWSNRVGSAEPVSYTGGVRMGSDLGSWLMGKDISCMSER
jgi:hypothetical protein